MRPQSHKKNPQNCPIHILSRFRKFPASPVVAYSVFGIRPIISFAPTICPSSNSITNTETTVFTSFHYFTNKLFANYFRTVQMEFILEDAKFDGMNRFSVASPKLYTVKSHSMDAYKNVF
jgi:hypothetical protein